MMGQVMRKLKLIDGGCFDLSAEASKQPAKQPQNNPEKWISSAELEKLSGVSQAAVHKALANRQWRGSELMVREEQTGRGRGGKTYRVHVDSLPSDLCEQWYLSHGIRLHEKVDPDTGLTIKVPEQAFRNDAKFEADLAVARWRHDLIRPVLAHASWSAERAGLIREIAAKPHLFPDGKRKTLTGMTLYNWVNAYEAEGLYGLIRKRRKDSGEKRTSVTRTWDAFFAPHIDAKDHDRIAEEITRYIRSLWWAGERGWRSVSEKSTTRLIEMSRELRVVGFDALETGRCGQTAKAKTQFGICHLNRRRVENERKYRIGAVKNKDNATFQDKYMPSIRRDYSDLLPREIVVGDVHPVDIMMRRPDGTEVWPKAISWYDVATNEIHMTFVLLEQGEGVRREHVAQSFQAMVEEWGLPRMLYLDNGSEYNWDAMIGGFTQLSKLTTMNGTPGIRVFDLDGNADVAARVAQGREAILRSRPYNAKGKPGIEGVFGNLEQVFFATIPGWADGDRMRKKTHAKGKDPLPFPGDARAFLEEAGRALEWYHKRPQQGKLAGRSPNQALPDFIDNGWGKTVLSSPHVLALAFAEVIERVPDRGRVSYKPRRGEAIYFYADELLGIDHKLTLYVPAFNPEFVFCFDGDEMICRAFPERAFSVLDPRGAQEVNRRGKAFRRQIAEKRRHVALLSLTEETARHISHMPDAPEVPVAAVVDAGMLDRMARIEAEEQARIAAAETKPRREPSQWATAPNAALAAVTYADEDVE